MYVYFCATDFDADEAPPLITFTLIGTAAVLVVGWLLRTFVTASMARHAIATACGVSFLAGTLVIATAGARRIIDYGWLLVFPNGD